MFFLKKMTLSQKQPPPAVFRDFQPIVQRLTMQADQPYFLAAGPRLGFESFDHIIRNAEDLEEKIGYIR